MRTSAEAFEQATKLEQTLWKLIDCDDLIEDSWALDGPATIDYKYCHMHETFFTEMKIRLQPSLARTQLKALHCTSSFDIAMQLKKMCNTDTRPGQWIMIRYADTILELPLAEGRYYAKSKIMIGAGA